METFPLLLKEIVTDKQNYEKILNLRNRIDEYSVKQKFSEAKVNCEDLISKFKSFSDNEKNLGLFF